MAGGLSRSPFFTQLLSDVLGRPVEVSTTPEASALGAAICAGVGAGVFADLEEGARTLTRVARICEPDAIDSAAYAEFYPAWNDLRLARVESDGMAAGLVIRGMLAGAARSD
jgi:sugar (pentulose or hexulose) kinase